MTATTPRAKMQRRTLTQIHFRHDVKRFAPPLIRELSEKRKRNLNVRPSNEYIVGDINTSVTRAFWKLPRFCAIL